MQTGRIVTLSLCLEKLKCPSCRSQSPTPREGENGLCCTFCGAIFPDEGQVPSLIPVQQRHDLKRFNDLYDELRLKEGWASTTPGYYEALPAFDITGRHSGEWQQRAKRFRAVEKWIARTFRGRSLDILDAGCGTVWTSRRLKQDGHLVIGTDVNPGKHGLLAVTDTDDHPFYIQTRLEDLTFHEDSFDLIMFNASLHYSSKLNDTLERAWRLLRKNGFCLIMDSPVYYSNRALSEAKERTKDYYTALGTPDMADLYHPFELKEISENTHFRVAFVLQDLSVTQWLRKRARERQGKTVGAYFPAFACKPVKKPGMQMALP